MRDLRTGLTVADRDGREEEEGEINDPDDESTDSFGRSRMPPLVSGSDLFGEPDLPNGSGLIAARSTLAFEPDRTERALPGEGVMIRIWRGRETVVSPPRAATRSISQEGIVDGLGSIQLDYGPEETRGEEPFEEPGEHPFDLSM